MKRRLVKLDAAFSYSLNRIYGKRTSGEDTHVWVRATAYRRNIRDKWDGYRALAATRDDGVSLYSRKGIQPVHRRYG